MDKQLTPIMQAIELLRAKARAINDDKVIDRNRKGAYVDAIVILTEHLPQEYEHLEKAYKNGWDFGYKHVSTPAKTYIDNTYNTLK
jgi:hypothetical protein